MTGTSPSSAPPTPSPTLTVVSIYVNPGQFAPSEDFSTYPSDLTGDLKKLANLGIVHAVFCPSNLYDYEGGSSAMPTTDRASSPVSCIEVEGDGSGHETWIRVEKLERGLCGKSRPVFFRGVATVVAKLFNIVEPYVAVFGKKDYQQWRIICRMVPVRSANIDSCIRVNDNGRENIMGNVFFLFTLHNTSNDRKLKLSTRSSEEAAKWINTLMEAKFKECAMEEPNVAIFSKRRCTSLSWCCMHPLWGTAVIL